MNSKTLLLALLTLAISGCGAPSPTAAVAPTTTAVATVALPTATAATATPAPTARAAAAAPTTTAAATSAPTVAATATRGRMTPPPTVAGAVFGVTRPDGSVKVITVAELRQLPIVTIMADGKPQEGPTLQAVLTAAGVNDFTAVTVVGREGSMTLTRAEVLPDVVLDFANRGTVKLISPRISLPSPVQDVSDIQVK